MNDKNEDLKYIPTEAQETLSMAAPAILATILIAVFAITIIVLRPSEVMQKWIVIGIHIPLLSSMIFYLVYILLGIKRTGSLNN